MSNSISLKINERINKNPNVTKGLLEQGQKVYYSVKKGLNIVEYPDGRKFRVEIVNGSIVEREAYEERRPA